MYVVTGGLRPPAYLRIIREFRLPIPVRVDWIVSPYHRRPSVERLLSEVRVKKGMRVFEVEMWFDDKFEFVAINKDDSPHVVAEILRRLAERVERIDDVY